MAPGNTPSSLQPRVAQAPAAELLAYPMGRQQESPGQGQPKPSLLTGDTKFPSDPERKQ